MTDDHPPADGIAPAIPSFAPEHFAVVRAADVGAFKPFRRGIDQLDREGGSARSPGPPCRPSSAARWTAAARARCRSPWARCSVRCSSVCRR